MTTRPTTDTPVGAPEAAEHYREVAAAFTDRLQGVAADQWSLPTPCSEWAVRELVAHVVGVHHMFLVRLEGADQPAEVPADRLVQGWQEATAAVSAALADPVRASTRMTGVFGDQPFAVLVDNLLCADTLVHTWDLARATGQQESLQPAAVDRCLEFLTPMDEGMRRPGGFAARIDPPPGVDEQTRLLNFCGRAV